ncbi:MAG TPA: 6-bladed beta-propeller [Bryobacteraceae bacterium]|nr:6-bladed beta-propeller [Bryobacteraceae bacterium]
MSKGLFLSCLALQAVVLQAEDAPRLPLEQVPLNSVGTVSSVAIDPSGVMYVLQRGDKADPVIAVNKEGQTLRSWGKGMFTVPHSVRIDGQGNVWTVDAGSSTILKFTPQGQKLQQIDVGQIAVGDKCAVPPSLCGTTDITFGPNGRLFISDGYGNARILEYTADGRRVKVWGSAGTGPGQFNIPHGIATQENTLYIADRGNSRVQRFDLDGRYLGEWTHLGRPFALKVSGGALWVSSMLAKPTIFKIDLATGKILGQMDAPGPHSIDVNNAGEVVASGCCGGSNPNGYSWFRKN